MQLVMSHFYCTTDEAGGSGSPIPVAQINFSGHTESQANVSLVNVTGRVPVKSTGIEECILRLGY